MLHPYNLQCLQSYSMTVKAAVYTRIRPAVGDGLDRVPEEQQRVCLEAAAVRGWQVVSQFSDGQRRSRKDIPPGLARFIDAAHRIEITAVIIPSLDSLGRSPRAVLLILKQLHESQVIIVSCKEGIDSETASGRLVLDALLSLAKLEADQRVTQAIKGRNARGRIDGERGGQLPMGYKRVFNERGKAFGLEIEESTAETVRYIFVLRSRGNSLQAIADKLNDFGVTTSRGKRWHPSSVKAVLDNEHKYRGGRRWKSSFHWPKILEY